MKVELFPFQKTALARLRQSAATALGNYRSTHTPQVVSYTAPTGAGKTIVMSALIEDIYYGDELYPEQPEAIFIWLSDSPQLNEQSRLKIDLKADKIRLNQCVVISDDSFDMEVLEDGHIYFLNTQKHFQIQQSDEALGWTAVHHLGDDLKHRAREGRPAVLHH